MRIKGTLLKRKYDDTNRQYNLDKIIIDIQRLLCNDKQIFVQMGGSEQEYNPNPAFICGIIKTAYIKGDEIITEFETIDTPSGKLLESLMIQNIPLSLSATDYGDVNSSGIVDNYNFIMCKLFASYTNLVEEIDD